MRPQEVLERAKKTNRTGFTQGDGRSYPVVASRTIKTPQGDWIVNGDGTVTDQRNNLTWIQAPWGKTWDGQRFSGESVHLSWSKATNLFGRGVFAYADREVSSYSPKDWEATAYKNGYTHGRCRVIFANRNDWRLPTVMEFCTHTFAGDFDERLQAVLFPGTVRGSYLTASGKKKLLFLTSVVWKGWFGGRCPNDENPDIPYPMLFVRSGA